MKGGRTWLRGAGLIFQLLDIIENKLLHASFDSSDPVGVLAPVILESCELHVWMQNYCSVIVGRVMQNPIPVDIRLPLAIPQCRLKDTTQTDVPLLSSEIPQSLACGRELEGRWRCSKVV